ncbi:helix-turn-helix domain-containing protein [Vibrio parahaemolyticus]|uniref:hypothetical protein n=1 Tax=Vibrio parahaemolyticus TaxID=670 RepID=UPI0004D877E4|nr:hypothetical protein [Vibrio parahaemolyticus]MDI7850354.1 winged helix-turn-helix domain-containing protein [Vibrio parahaemolyticus]MDZ5127600.1 hypothetical protein [Vibrio parahaemolyticus]MDZ5209415.1 hypothetical protein [Vibrio parahaemolyticus]
MKEFGEHYHPDSIYYLPDHMGFSWITSRSNAYGQKSNSPKSREAITICVCLSVRFSLSQKRN